MAQILNMQSYDPEGSFVQQMPVDISNMSPEQLYGLIAQNAQDNLQAAPGAPGMNVNGNIQNSPFFNQLSPQQQQDLLSYQTQLVNSRQDSGWGAFLGGLGLMAAPFAIGSMTGTLGSGGLGAFTGADAATPSIMASGDAGIGSGSAFAGDTVSGMGGGVGLTAPAAGGGTLGAGGMISGGASTLAPSLGAGSSLGGMGTLSNLGSVAGGLGSLFGSGGSSGILGSLGDIASGSMSLLPGTLALNYARNNSGIDTSNLSSILGGLQGNQNAIISAATDPLQRNIASGYGDLLQSQAARGIRGSSFGDTDIANYLANTGSALSNAGANAAEGSLSLQGNLASQIAQLNNQSQLQKNTLYGNAFDALGRALNPAGYAGSTNIGGTNTGSTSGISQLLTGLGSLGKGLYGMFA